MSYGMVIDLRRCVGCNACTIACKSSNGTPPGMFYSHVAIDEEGTYPNAVSVYTPMLCGHCDDASCVSVCPTGASYRDEDGVVRVDHDKCIGCKYCIAACPYGARSFLADKIEGYFPGHGLTQQEALMYQGFEVGKVYKCDFCRSKGYTDTEGPSCVRACPGDARIFGDVDDPESEIAKILAEEQTSVLGEEYGTNPRVWYVAR